MRLVVSLAVSLAAVASALAQGPTLPPNSMVNGASFRPAADPGGAVAPGTIVAIFGSNLAGSVQQAMSVPLSTTLGDTSVTFNNVSAPLFFVSGGQVNAQVPFETPAGTVSVQVRRQSGTSTQQMAIAGVSPGIFTLPATGMGPAAILHADTFQIVTQSAPARPSEFLLIFCTGLGPVDPPVPSGHAAPSAEPLARTVRSTSVLVNIGNPPMPAQVFFSGLAPGFVGLYQINVQLPAAPPRGTQPIQIVVNNVPSNSATIEIQ